VHRPTVSFEHADSRVPDAGALPPKCSWDYAVRLLRRAEDGGGYACQSDTDLALCTCGSGHTCRLSGRVHQVAPDGTVTPSYVCPVAGCGFHVWIRLVGWDPDHTFEEKTL
jgi:hypothetical protein